MSKQALLLTLVIIFVLGFVYGPAALADLQPSPRANNNSWFGGNPR